METMNRVLVIFCLFALSIAFLSFQFMQKQIDELKEETIQLKEDLQIHQDVFNSHLQGTLSQDWGGE